MEHIPQVEDGSSREIDLIVTSKTSWKGETLTGLRTLIASVDRAIELCDGDDLDETTFKQLVIEAMKVNVSKATKG